MLEQAVLSHPALDNYYSLIQERYYLSDRELEVLKVLTIMGPSNRELGVKLNVTEKTMKNHIYSIQKKTCTRSTRELQAMIFRDTLVPLLYNVFRTTDNSCHAVEGTELVTGTRPKSRQVG
ncbi:helix-turn-helix transcriptional regulator [Bacillus cereus]|nr:helix-turn-helix transcriptional regulator [Bacillus cereus]